MKIARLLRHGLLCTLTSSLMACSLPFGNGVTVFPPLPGVFPSSVSVNPSAVESAIIRYTNDERIKAGLTPLQEHQTLNALARKHSEDMSARGYYEHTDPEGRGPTQRLQEFFPGTLVSTAENIHMYSRARQTNDEAFARAMVDDWMNSSGHRANILKADYKWIGVGIASGKEYLYGTQNFSF